MYLSGKLLGKGQLNIIRGWNKDLVLEFGVTICYMWISESISASVGKNRELSSLVFCHNVNKSLLKELKKNYFEIKILFY